MNTAYVAARDRLLTQLALDDGFWFALVVGPDERPRTRLRRVLEASCRDHGIPFFLHGGASSSLPERAVSLARAPQPGVHWFRGDDPDALGPLLLALNERRDAYVARLRGAILVEGRAGLSRQLQELAPDLFSIAVPIPTPGADGAESDEPPGLPSALWHLLPEIDDAPTVWLDRAQRATETSGRFAASVHALESLMAHEEFSRAAPVAERCEELARALDAEGTLAPPLAALHRRARVWRAALANEAGEAARALELLTPLRAEAEEATPDERIEAANAWWRMGEHDRAFGAWERVLRGWIEHEAPRTADLARGALVTLWRAVSVGRADVAVPLWEEALRAPAVADALVHDPTLAAEAWLRLEHIVLFLARADGALSRHLTASLQTLAARDPTPWRVLEALGAFGRAVAAGETSVAAAVLERAVEEGRRAAPPTGALGDLALVVAEVRWANLAATVVPSPEVLRRVDLALERAATLQGPLAVQVRARHALHAGVIARVHLLERSGRYCEAATTIDRHGLLRDDATEHHRATATILRCRMLHRLGRRGEAIGALTAALPALERRGKPLSAEQKENLVCAWRDLGDLFLEDEAWESAASAYTAAARVARRYLLQHPDEVEALKDLAMALAPLAMVTLRRGDLRKATALHEEDLDIARRLVALDPRSNVWRRDLALSLMNGFGIHLARGDTEAALADLEASRALARAVLRDDPEDTVARNLLRATEKEHAALCAAVERGGA